MIVHCNISFHLSEAKVLLVFQKKRRAKGVAKLGNFSVWFFR
jgi:hypothetical protein